MQIFDRYILKEFIKFAMGSVILFTGVGIIVKILESLRITNQYSGDSLTIFLFYLYNIPFMMSIVMGPAFLLSASYVTSKIVQTKELTIVRSAGRSVKRTMFPILAFSFLFYFVLLAFNEYVAYPANFKAYEKYNKMKGRALDFHAWRGRYHFNLRSKNRVFYMNVFLPKEKKALGLHIAELNPEGNIQKIIRAEEALIEPHAWTIKKAQVVYFENSVFREQVYYRKKVFDIPEDFTVFQNTYYDIQEANIFQLLELIRNKKARGADGTEFEVEFYWHLGFPLACFFFAIVGIAVAVNTSSGGFAYSLSVSVVCAAIYFLMMFYSKALGTSHIITPFLAGFTGNMIMGGIALYGWFRMFDR